jgi:hypothetical protein
MYSYLLTNYYLYINEYPFQDLFSKLYTCLLSIFKAFLPNSKANPNVNTKKNTNIINNPYIPLVYALTT